MVVTVKEGAEGSQFIYGRHVYEEGIAITTTYKNVLLIDARRVNQTVIEFNNIGSDDLHYQIFATAKPIPEVLQYVKTPTNTAVDKTSIEWVNLLSIIEGATGSTYDHTFQKTLGDKKRFYESFANEWTAVLVTAKSDTSSTILSIWSRGQN